MQGGLIAESTFGSLVPGTLSFLSDLGKQLGGDLMKSMATQLSSAAQRDWQSAKVLAEPPLLRLVPYVARRRQSSASSCHIQREN